MGTDAHIKDFEQRLADAEAKIAALSESEERYRALFDATDSFCILEMI